MSEIVLRKLSKEDVNEISSIAKQTFYNAFSGTCTGKDMQHFLDFYYNENQILKEVENENMHYYFAEINNRAVAYMLFAENNPGFKEMNNKKTLELKRFYVHDEFHGKNIAQTMMNFFLQFAEKENYDIAFLGVWEYNYKAQNFYKKYDFGFTNHRHDFPIGETAQTDIYLLKHLQ
jgi:diamine N-acetyltransferase